MAEELKTPAPAVETADSELRPERSEGSSQPTGGEQEKRQPKQAKINLDELPEFRQAKSSYDRQIAQANQRAQQAEQRIQQMEQHLHQLSIRDLPEEEQRLATLQRQLEQAEAARQEAVRYALWLEDSQKAQQKADAALMRVATKTGFPLEDARKILMETGDPDAVWEAAHEWAKDGRHKRRRTDDDDDEDEGTERARRNRVDTGDGKAQPTDDRSQRLKKAFADKDADSFYRVMLARS